MKRVYRRSMALVAVGLAWSATAALAQPQEHAYVGTNSCKKCHIKEWRSWSETKMAKALETLKPGVAAEAKKAAGLDPDKDYTKDAACLVCHVTGWGKPGGFESLEATPDRAGIGCESCHGAGGTYTGTGYMTFKNREYKRADLVQVGLVAKVGAEQCTTCHNDKNPVAPKEKFDFDTMKTKGLHENFPLKYPH